MVRQAGLSSFPSLAQRAITLRHTNMRGLPTGHSLPDIRNAPLAPLRFDRLQISSIPPGTPVYVSHRSRDRLWCLAETGFAVGWLPTRDLALADDAFFAQWETGTYAAVIKDKKNIALPGGRHLDVSVGSLFPVVSEHPDSLKILTVRSDRKGHAVAVQTAVSRDIAVRTPLPLTPEYLAALANEFVGEPYGWGGQEGWRDCSSMIRDLFTPFGIWLPRHSADQALEGGWFVDLVGKSREEKQTAIITRGVPYLTLLWLKGHIMLYVGASEGRLLVFHNFWSVRTTNLQGIRGKKIVGQTAITTLHPGREFQPPGSSDGNLLDALQGMTLLVAPNFLVNR
jgi:cell wall-associated NlpC family hydrolase